MKPWSLDYAGRRSDRLMTAEPAGRDVTEWQDMPRALHHSDAGALWHMGGETPSPCCPFPNVSDVAQGLLPQRLQPDFMMRKLLCCDSRSLFTWSCWHITAKMNKPLDNNKKQISWFKQKYYGNRRWCSLVIKSRKWRYVIRKAKSAKKISDA